eukprot:6325664-Amphidinium_carterae.2
MAIHASLNRLRHNERNIAIQPSRASGSPACRSRLQHCNPRIVAALNWQLGLEDLPFLTSTMLALPIEQMSSRSSVSRRPSFYLPDNTEGSNELCKGKMTLKTTGQRTRWGKWKWRYRVSAANLEIV